MSGDRRLETREARLHRHQARAHEPGRGRHRWRRRDRRRDRHRPRAVPATRSRCSTAPAIDPVDLGKRRRRHSAAAAGVLEQHGRCDVLVHAAAAFDRAPLADARLETWRRVQAVNVESALWLSQAFAPGMAERGFGRIVFVVSDTVWEPPAPDLLAYVASKAALIGVARTLARALGRDGITVNCVAPGLTPTPAAVAETPPEAFARGAGAPGDPPTAEPGRRCRRRRVPRERRRGRDHRADDLRRRRPDPAVTW